MANFKTLLARNILAAAPFFLSAIIISGCSFPGVYKINVQQGTIVKQEDLDKLAPGMSRKQVHFVLGTPSLTNTFDSSNETYLYTYQKKGGAIKEQKVIVFYDERGFYDHHQANLLEDTPAY